MSDESASEEASGSGEASAGGDDDATPVGATRGFVDGVVWGEHRKVWELMGVEARTTVLKVASARGMDEDLVSRLRDSVATDAERDEFLADLVTGLRADLAGNDLDALQYAEDHEPMGPGRVRVVISVPVAVGFGGNLPVASVELETEFASAESSAGAPSWRVQRLIPQVTK